MESGKLIKVEALPRESEYVQEQIIEVLRKLANNPGALERSALRRPTAGPRAVHEQLRGAVPVDDQPLRLDRDAVPQLPVPRQRQLLAAHARRVQRQEPGQAQRGRHGPRRPVRQRLPGPAGQEDPAHPPARPGYTPTRSGSTSTSRAAETITRTSWSSSISCPAASNTGLGIEAGNAYDGNMFLNKDGTQLVVPFPEYRGCPSTSAAWRPWPS
jgi:hypothetical protein